jgi:hypothetical protein
LKEALEQLQLAEKSDPLAHDIQGVYSDILFAQGRFDQAAEHCASPCPRAMILQGKAAEAASILEKRFSGRPNASGTGLLGYAYAVAGERRMLRESLRCCNVPLKKPRFFWA